MCHVLGTEMLHFIHQMQYYITFEVRNSPAIHKLLKLTASWATSIQEYMVGLNSMSQNSRSVVQARTVAKYFWEQGWRGGESTRLPPM